MAGEHEVADGLEVAERFRHLVALDEQEAHVHPEAREHFSGRRFRLRDLVLVMREHQVFAAGVQVERGAEILHRHRRALDVPAGTSWPERRLPMRLAGFGRFPEREIAGLFLVETVGVHTRAIFYMGEVLLRELAVGRKLGHAVVAGAIVGAVGHALLRQLGDELGHILYMFGGAGDDLWLFEVEIGGVLEESGLVLAGVVGDALATLFRALDDAVVHVGDVHDVAQFEPLLAQGAAQDVDGDEGAEIADVGEVVDGGSAGVHADERVFGGLEVLHFPGERVEEAQGHVCRVLRMARVNP